MKNRYLYLGAILAGLLTLAASAQAGDAKQCVSLKSRSGGHGQELFNSCNVTVEAVWCVSKSGNPYQCQKFNMRTNIPSGRGYSVEKGRVVWGACAGRDSVKSTGRDELRYGCK